MLLAVFSNKEGIDTGEKQDREILLVLRYPDTVPFDKLDLSLDKRISKRTIKDNGIGLWEDATLEARMIKEKLDYVDLPYMKIVGDTFIRSTEKFDLDHLTIQEKLNLRDKTKAVSKALIKPTYTKDNPRPKEEPIKEGETR